MIYQSKSVINYLNVWEYQQTEIRFIMKSREHRFWKYLLVNSRINLNTHIHTYTHTHTHTHIGIEGNEAADKLAKEAANDENDQNIVYDRVPATTVDTEINKQGFIKWQSQWNSTEREREREKDTVPIGLPSGGAEIKNEDTRIYCYHHRTWGNKILLTQV